MPSIATLPYTPGSCSRLAVNLIPHGGFGSAFVRTMGGIILAHKLGRQYVQGHAHTPYDEGCEYGRIGMDCFFLNFSNCRSPLTLAEELKLHYIDGTKYQAGGRRPNKFYDTQVDPALHMVHAFHYDGYAQAVDKLAGEILCLEAHKSCDKNEAGVWGMPKDCSRPCHKLPKPPFWNAGYVCVLCACYVCARCFRRVIRVLGVARDSKSRRLGQLRVIAHAMYRPRPEVEAYVRREKESLALRHPYITVHFRRGDKFKEAPRIKPDKYMSVLRKAMRAHGIGDTHPQRRLVVVNHPLRWVADAHGPAVARDAAHAVWTAHGSVNASHAARAELVKHLSRRRLHGTAQRVEGWHGWGLDLELDLSFVASPGRVLGARDSAATQVYVMGDEYSALQHMMAAVTKEHLAPTTLADPNVQGYVCLHAWCRRGARLSWCGSSWHRFVERKFKRKGDYTTSKDKSAPKTQKTKLALEMFRDYHMAVESDLYVGTQSSNVASMVQLLRHTANPNTVMDVKHDDMVQVRECARADEPGCVV